MANSDSPVLVENENKTWRREFSGPLDNFWTVTTGAGQTATTSNGALVINAGTTNAAETIIQSVETFTFPFRVQFAEMQSQRIAGNEFSLEVVAKDDPGSYVGWVFDGTAATTAKFSYANNGISTPASPSAGQTVATSSAATPVIREIDLRADQVLFHDRAVDSAAQGSLRFTKTRAIPHPDREFYVRIRVKNTAAPATATTYTLESLLVQDITKVVAEVTGGRGSGALSQSIPVQVLNAPAVTMTSTTLSASASTAILAPSTVRIPALLAAPTLVSNAANKKVYWVDVHNPNATVSYLHIYNLTVGGTTVGTSTPVWSIAVPPNDAVQYPVGGVPYLNNASAITVAATTTAAGNTAPAVGLLVNVGFA